MARFPETLCKGTAGTTASVGEAHAMTLADDAAAALPQLVRLAEEHGPALSRAFRIIGDGALVGPAGMELFDGLSWRHREALNAFDYAYFAVNRLAATATPPPRVAAPRLPGMPSPPAQHGGERGGDPALLDQLATELSRAGRAFEDAGNTIVTMLNRLSLDPGPGYAISRAGGWIVDCRKDLQRRREQLLKADDVGSLRPGDTGGHPPSMGKPAKSSTSWWSPTNWGNLYLHHFLPGVLGSLKQSGLSAAAVNPVSAVVYMAVDWNGWKKHGAPGMISGATYAIHHPGKAFNAIINLDEWKQDPVKAWGNLAPDIVFTAMTLGSGGGTAAAKRAQGAAARLAGLRRLAKLRRISTVEKPGHSLENVAKDVGRTKPFDKPRESQVVPTDSMPRDLPATNPPRTQPDGRRPIGRPPTPGARNFTPIHQGNASQRLFKKLFPHLEHVNPNYSSKS